MAKIILLNVVCYTPNLSHGSSDSQITENRYTYTRNISDEELDPENVINVLKSLRKKNLLLIAQLNTNSIRNKLDALDGIIERNIDILLVIETKLDETFSNAQIKMNGSCEPFRLDKNSNEGVILIFLSGEGSLFLSEVCLLRGFRNTHYPVMWRQYL